MTFCYAMHSERSDPKFIYLNFYLYFIVFIRLILELIFYFLFRIYHLSIYNRIGHLMKTKLICKAS